jgi:hypothetical protein
MQAHTYLMSVICYRIPLVGGRAKRCITEATAATNEIKDRDNVSLNGKEVGT